jgi:cytochrome c oxidase subunit I
MSHPSSAEPAELEADEATPALTEVKGPRLNYLNDGTTLRSWMLTLDHKRIAILYLVLTMSSFIMGGVFALLIRIKLLTPGPWLFSANAYNRLFTMHGVVMIFLFLIPSIPGIFGNFLLPLMLGAKDVAFPKLNLFSVYLYLAGAALALWGLVHGGADTGWTFYTPYSTTTPAEVVPILLGAFILGFSSIVTGLNFIVTTHTMRAPGLTWMKLPLFVWGIYATAIIQVLATPVLGMVLLLVAVERSFGFGIFDPARGGDPVLFEHLFWFYSHPAVYIMILPSMGVVSEVVACFSHNRPYGYKVIAYSSLGIAFIGFLGWGHHMFVSGESIFIAGAFSFLTMLVGIFSAAKTFSWVGTMYKGSVDFRTPLAYVFGFLFFFVFGGMTGVALATLPLDVHWHDTYFIVAHFHFIMVGAAVMAFMAALHYWFPLMFGKKYSERWGLSGAFFTFIGFVVTFFPQFLLGNEGMPRRYYQYPDHFQILNVVSTVGSWILALGVLVTLLTLAYGLILGEPADKHSWGSRGFEWRADAPPITQNFVDQPVIAADDGPYSYHLAHGHGSEARHGS